MAPLSVWYPPFLLQDEETPLHVAALGGHHETCNLLLEKGADLHAQKSVSASFSWKARSTWTKNKKYVISFQKKGIFRHVLEYHKHKTLLMLPWKWSKNNGKQCDCPSYTCDITCAILLHLLIFSIYYVEYLSFGGTH